MDSLHAIVQLPGGIPVATVAIGGGLDAGLLAARILALADAAVAQQLAAYSASLHDQVVAKDQSLQQLGTATYLERLARR